MQSRALPGQSKMTGRYAGQMRQKQGDHEWKTRCGKATKHAARCDKDVAMDLAILISVLCDDGAIKPIGPKKSSVERVAGEWQCKFDFIRELEDIFRVIQL